MAAGAAPKGLCLGLVLALAACSSPDAFRPGCPSVGVIRDLGTLLVAEGQARVVMSNLQAECDYDSDQVTVSAALTLRGDAAPTYGGGPIPVTYFVAVTAPDRSILRKQVFSTTVPAAGLAVETLVQAIPAPRTVDARYYEVLVGFQLTPDQAEANRIVNEAR